jgi:hypothetical protein
VLVTFDFGRIAAPVFSAAQLLKDAVCHRFFRIFVKLLSLRATSARLRGQDTGITCDVN